MRWTFAIAAVSIGLWSPTTAADPKPPDLYAKCLPSVATLRVHETDGSQSVGSAFLAIKDGILVTAWHVVRDAESATARFSTGEEFETSGLIDKDEKRDIALVRLKSFGRPMLTLSRTTPKVASRVYAIGAPKGLEFSISDGLVSQIQKVNASTVYQFTSPVSPGNSGGPLLSESGEVLGVVIGQMEQGQNLNFAAPSTFVLGLDSTLPTKPWDSARGPGAAPGRRPDPRPDRLASEGRSLVLDSDPVTPDDVKKLCAFLKDSGFVAMPLIEGAFMLRTRLHKATGQLILDDEVDRILIKVYYGVEPRFVHTEALHAFVLEANQTYNLGSFSLEEDDSEFVVSMQITFVDRIEAAELQGFLNWMDKALVAFGVASKASTFLK